MMLTYLSASPGIGGAIKSVPEDFLVEEIARDGTVLELDKPFSKTDQPGRFVHFVLQKNNWSTSSALSEIADRLRISNRHMNAAGNKDKIAITTQLASAGGTAKEKILALAIKDIKINGAWTAPDKVMMGALLGNRFTIRVQAPNPNASERMGPILSELNGLFPNYFGEQRFGSSRKNTARIGEMILRDEFEQAVRLFLCGIEGEENAQARMARKELAETSDYSRALSYFPRHLKLERSLLAYLAKKQDYPGALKQLPRNILLLFIHAFQSDMFNTLLSERIKENELVLEKGEYYCGETLGFPDINKTEAEGWIAGKIIGYETPLNEREEALLVKLDIRKESFRMKSMPEIASRGTYRTLLAPMKDFNFDGERVFRFSLPSGSYATVAMAEFMKGG